METSVAFPSIHIADCSLTPTLIPECRLSAPSDSNLAAMRPAEQQYLRDCIVGAVSRHMISSRCNNRFGQGAFIRCRYLDSQQRTVALSRPVLLAPPSGLAIPLPGAILTDGYYRQPHSLKMQSFAVHAYFPERLPSCVAEVIFEVTPPLHPFGYDQLHIAPVRHLFQQRAAIDYSFESVTFDAHDLRRLADTLPYDVAVRIPARHLYPTALIVITPPESFLNPLSATPVLPTDPANPANPDDPQAPNGPNAHNVHNVVNALNAPNLLHAFNPPDSLSVLLFLCLYSRPNFRFPCRGP